MKRWFCLFMTLCMLLSSVAFAAEAVTYPISEEVITITVAGANYNTEDWNETIQVQEIEKRLGIRLECTSYEADVWQTQLTLMMASDDLPDLIINPDMTLAEANDYGAQGYFLDMKDLINQYAPNILQTAEEYPTYMNYCTSPDGGVYTLCQITTNPIAQVSRAFLNKKWMDNLGLEYPETIDDLHVILTAFKEQDANGNGDPNDEIPMTCVLDWELLTNLMSAFGIFSYGNENQYLLAVDDAGQVYLSDTTENYKAFLTWMNELWDEGLLYVNALLPEGSDELSMMLNDDIVGMFGTSAPFAASGNTIDFDANYYWIGGLTSEWNDTPSIAKSNSVTPKPKVLVNAETEYPEEIVKLLDYFFTPEGILSGSYGYEGSCFDMVPGKYEGLSEYSIVEMYQPEGYGSGEEFRFKKAICNEAFNFVKPFEGTQYPMILAADDEQLEEMLPEYGWAVRLTQNGLNRCELVESFPGLIYTDEENMERTQLYTDIKLYLQTMQAQFISGQTNIETGWQPYLDQLNAMGLERLLEIEQQAYDRLMGA